MVTHDVDEAVLLSDRIVMMTNGPAATMARYELASTPPHAPDARTTRYQGRAAVPSVPLCTPAQSAA